jgi:hypothetical protein
MKNTMQQDPSSTVLSRFRLSAFPSAKDAAGARA